MNGTVELRGTIKVASTRWPQTPNGWGGWAQEVRVGSPSRPAFFLFCLEEMSPTFTQLQMKEDQHLFKICRTVFMGRLMVLRASLVVQTVKNLPAMQETWDPSLGREDPLEEGMATHSIILTWRIPWTEEPGGLQSMGSQRVRHD